MTRDKNKVLMIGLDPKVVDYSHLAVKLDERELGPRESAARQDLLQHRSRGHRSLRSTLGLTAGPRRRRRRASFASSCIASSDRPRRANGRFRLAPTAR